MKSRSFRLFGVRFLLGFEVTKVSRYHIYHHPLECDSDQKRPTQYSSDSLPLMQKALPEVAKEMGKKFRKDSRCVIVDLDNGAEEVGSRIGFHVESEVIREEFVSVSEYVKLK